MSGKRRKRYWLPSYTYAIGTRSKDPALQVACPDCGVSPGRPCVDSRGRPVHAGRRELSWKNRHAGDL